MSTSIMKHDVKSITTDGVSYCNSNAITLKISATGEDLEITLFDLPTETATRIDAALREGSGLLTEEQIRADERRKIAHRIGVSV